MCDSSGHKAKYFLVLSCKQQMWQSHFFPPHGYVFPKYLFLLAAFDLSLMRWPHYSFVKFLPKNGTLCSDFLFMSHNVTKRAAATLRSWFIASTPCWERLFLFFGSIHIFNFFRWRLNSQIFCLLILRPFN